MRRKNRRKRVKYHEASDADLGIFSSGQMIVLVG